MNCLKIAGAVAVALIAGVASAETYTWTGAADSLYTNAANWTVSGGAVATTAPGRYLDAGGTETGSFDDSVLFGPLAGADAATIDFAGAVSVSNFVIRAGAPAYTFGVTNRTTTYKTAQTFTIICGVASSSAFANFAVESGVTAQQTVALAITFGKKDYYQNIVNNGSKDLLFAFGLIDSYNSKVFFRGTGDIRVRDYRAESYMLTHAAEGRVVFERAGTGGGYTKGFSQTGDFLHRFYMTPAGSYVGIKDNLAAIYSFFAYYDCLFTGPGYFRVANMKNTTYDLAVGVDRGRTLTFDCPLNFYYTPSACSALYPERVHVYGPGTAVINNLCTGVHRELCIGGATTTASYRNTTLVLPYIGGTNDALSHVGQNVTNLTFAADGTLAYSGPGETADLPIRGVGAATQVMTILNRGTGPLTYAGEVRSVNAGAKLRLTADTQPIVFDGTCDCADGLTLVVAGTNVVRVATPDVADAYVFEAGRLEITAAGDYTNTATLASGASRVIVPDGTRLTLDGLTAAGGATLDFALTEGASHVYLTNFSGDPRSVVRINGESRCTLMADGELVLAVTVWKNATDGRWADGEKWSNGTPTADLWTRVIAAGETDYTVTVDAAPAAISALEIGRGTASPKATVDFQVPVTLTTSNAVQVLTGGVVRVSNGTTLLVTDERALNLEGGELDVKPGARLAYDRYVRFGTGTATFEDGAILTNAYGKSNGSPHVYIGANGPDQEARVVFNTIWGLEAWGGYFFVGCGQDRGGRAYLDFNNPVPCKKRWSGDYTNTYWNAQPPPTGTTYRPSMAVGLRRGYAEMNVKGASLTGDNYGLYIGSEVSPSGDYAKPSSDVNCATGVVNVLRGALYVGGYGCEYESGYICGIIVGHGTGVEAGLRGQSFFRGELNLTGDGEIGMARGTLMVGTGAAEGVLCQTDGTIALSSYSPLIVGFEGGNGLCDLRGGVFSGSRAFIGGCSVDDVPHMSIRADHLKTDWHDAVGTLRLAGGRATLTGDIAVAKDGTGLVEVSGTNATTCATLNLMNANATLAFRFPASGRPKWTFRPSALTIGSGAKLKVDLADCANPPGGWRTLLETETIAGAFADADILIRFPGQSEYVAGKDFVKFEHKGRKGIWLRTNRGVALLVR